jgi:integrase
MAIKEYQCNGKTLFEVYVHVKSSTDATIRVQKRKRNIESYKDAARDEMRMIKEASTQLGVLETKGGTWERLIDLWYYDQVRNTVGSRYSSQFTLTDYRNMLRRYTADWLKQRPAEISRGDGRRVIENLRSEGRSISYILKVKNTISLVFQWGDENRLLHSSVSPVQGIKVDNKVEKFPEILSLSEIRRFLYEAKIRSHPWYPIWAMALLTGMRSGELYALEWSDVDFEKQVVRVKKSFCKRTAGIKSTKAGYWRNVPISSELHSLLNQMLMDRAGGEYVLPRLVDWSRGEQAKHLRFFLEGLGLPSVRFHTLRACFATQLLSDGVEPIRVMKIGGWKDLKTMQVYLRMAGIEEAGATESLKFLPADADVMERVVQLFQ